MPVSLDYDTTYDLGGMTSADAGEAVADADFVVLPTGSIEQHAQHLPVSVDTLRAESLTRERLEERFGDDWGHAGEHETSVIELFHPDLVDSEAKRPQEQSRYEVRQYAYFDEVTPGGGLGDPTASDPGFVEGVIEAANADILEALKRDMAAEAED